MIQIDGDRIKRGGQIVGYIDGYHIKDRDYKNLGYYEGNYIYDETGKKLSYIESDWLYSYASRSSYTKLEDITKDFPGSVLPEIVKCAIFQLLGA